MGGGLLFSSSLFKLSTLATMLSLAKEVREMPGVADEGRSKEPGLSEVEVNLECSALGDPILAEGDPSLLVAAGEEILWVGELTAASFLDGESDGGGDARGWVGEVRGLEGEEEDAEMGSRDGEVDDAEKGLVGVVPVLLGDPWVDEDSSCSWIGFNDSCVLLGDCDCDLLEEGTSLLDKDCCRGGLDRPWGGLAGLEEVVGSSGKLENSYTSS